MAGFIGARARKKRLNIIIFFIVILIIILFYYILPIFKLNETMPSNTLLPSLGESISTESELTIEDLELKIFNREQKIFFRDKEITKIKTKLKILVNENKQLSNTILDLNNQQKPDFSNSEKFKSINKQLEKIKKNNKKELLKLNDIILKITIEKNNLFKSVDRANSENKLSKNKYKIIIDQNIKLTDLKDLLEKEIERQIGEIDELNLSIQILKDKYHHR